MPNSVAYLKSARLGGDGKTLVCTFDYPFAKEIANLGDTAVPRFDDSQASLCIKARAYQGSGEDEIVSLRLKSIESKIFPGKDFGRWTATFALDRKMGLSRFSYVRLDYNQYGLFVDHVGGIVSSPIADFLVDNTNAL